MQPFNPLFFRTTWLLIWLIAATLPAEERIDRQALVSRHSPQLSAANPLAPFSVGNGKFVFTADITGLQTFPENYAAGIPLHTQAEFGWHSFPNPGHLREEVRELYPVGGRQIPYASVQEGPAADYFRGNPHRLDLGRVGLVLRGKDGSAAKLSEITNINQRLDLWRGELVSTFTFAGEPAEVRTACHPERDALGAQITSPLIERGQLGVLIAFPGAKADWKECADWNSPDAHSTELADGENQWDFSRQLDETTYYVQITSDGAPLKVKPIKPHHHYELRATTGSTLRFTCDFAANAKQLADSLTVAKLREASADHWRKFWESGAAVEFAGSTDPRAVELERRVVLSQYLTAIQCCGSIPPQETGLTYNSWFGKAHTEMHWWHAVHFALWGRPQLLERSLGWYTRILPEAQALAQRQGYRGARWPKMVGPAGEESPSRVAAFLLWQQPHPIYYAELCYRALPTADTLAKYESMVHESAEFMASFPEWNADRKEFDLGPVVIPAQECYDPRTTINPTYELAYWQWALETAQKWRERRGQQRSAEWDKILTQLARPTVREGVYAAIGSPPYTNRHDHPSMLLALGMTPPTPLIDPQTMNRTYDDVLANWDWPTTWGWDYPAMAMTAARLGRPADAVNALLMPVQKNTYLPNGHNYQDDRLTIYLPGNGGLLAAVAMMAEGWEGCPKVVAPGFPSDGSWKVRAEGVKAMP